MLIQKMGVDEQEEQLGKKETDNMQKNKVLEKERKRETYEEWNNLEARRMKR